MKKLKRFALVLMTVLAAVNFAACSDDDDPKPIPEPTPEPTPEPLPAPTGPTYHFDIWVGDGQTQGMGRDVPTYVKSVPSVAEDTGISFSREGIDLGDQLWVEAIIKGKYYYGIPKSKDRFIKYQIKGDNLNIIAQRELTGNTFGKGYSYTHAWISDDEFVVLAANGPKDDVIWTKVKDGGETLSITAEGALNLPAAIAPEVISKYSTSGIAAYRKTDGRILYLFCEKDDDAPQRVGLAVVNPVDMTVEAVDFTAQGEEMAGSAYGELMQDKVFFDDASNLYVPVLSALENAESSSPKYSRMVRIKAGEKKFDTTWTGFDFNGSRDNGKIVTATYIGGNKALLYINDPVFTGVSDDNTKKAGWDRTQANSYYAIYDLSSPEQKPVELMYNGSKLPYNKGTFTQRSAVVDDVVYIGVNPDGAPACIYLYDLKTGAVTRGASIEGGLEFSRLVVVEND